MVVDDQANALPRQPFSDIPLKLVNLFDRRYVHVFKIDELKIDFVVHRFAIRCGLGRIYMGVGFGEVGGQTLLQSTLDVRPTVWSSAHPHDSAA